MQRLLIVSLVVFVSITVIYGQKLDESHESDMEVVINDGYEGRHSARGGEKIKEGQEHKKINAKQGFECDTQCCMYQVQKLKDFNQRGKNYKKMDKRFLKFNKQRIKFNGLKGVFGVISTHLVEVGGGNKSALVCSGNTTSRGAKRLQSIVEIIDQCKTNITEYCSERRMALPSAVSFYLNDCNRIYSRVADAEATCRYNPYQFHSLEQYCDCYFQANLEYDDFFCTNLPVTMPTTKKSFKICKETFNMCQKAKDEAASLLYTCTLTPAKLAAKAAQAKANKAALSWAQNETVGPYSIGLLNLILANADDKARNTTCKEFITLGKSVTKRAIQAPASSKWTSDAQSLANESFTRSCGQTELNELVNLNTSLEEATSVVSAVLDDFLAAIEEITGTALSIDSLSTEAPTATEAPITTEARRRLDFHVKDIQH